MRASISFAAILGVMLPASQAIACSVVLPKDYEGSARQRREVREAITQSPAIVDGEVIRPWFGGKPALVRIHHVLKGKVAELIEVGGPGAGGDCSLALEWIGERRRMILSGGPNLYDLFRDGSEARLEDRILKSDRRKIWPYSPGQTNTGR